MLSRRPASFLGLSLLWLALIIGEGAGQEPQQPTEYQIKAAFIFNFAKFVEWPKAALPQPNTPIVIGILGDNPFHGELDETIRDKTVDDHPLVVKEFQPSTPPTNCHLLFITSSEKPRLNQVLKDLKGAGVLTVAEMDGFTESGGMINFVREGTKIRFRINNEAARKEGLKISAKLLTLAVRS